VTLAARAVLGAVAVAIAGSVFAQATGQRLRDSAADTIDFTEKPLDELALQLPAPPKPGDLLEFDPGRPATLRFYIDPTSLSVGTDAIVRFTVVVRGDGSASNVSYEAIRCKTRERKIYAYGRADGTWSAVRAPQWTVLSSFSIDGYRFVLYENYFCPSRQIIASAREGVEALRRAGHPRASDLLTPTPMPR
jgi:CNP1-like family